MIFGLGFLWLQRDFRSGFLDQFAGRIQLLLRDQFVQRGAESFGAHAFPQAGAQIFALHSRQQRILFLKFLDLFQYLFANFFENSSGNQHERFHGNGFDAPCLGKFLGRGPDFTVRPRSARDNFFVAKTKNRALGHGRQNFFALPSFERF